MRVAWMVLIVSGCFGGDDSRPWAEPGPKSGPYMVGGWGYFVNPIINDANQVELIAPGTARDDLVGELINEIGQVEDVSARNQVAWYEAHGALHATSGARFAVQAGNGPVGEGIIPRLPTLEILTVSFHDTTVELMHALPLETIYDEMYAPPTYIVTQDYTAADINSYLAIDEAVVQLHPGRFPKGLVITGKHVRLWTQEVFDLNALSELSDLTIEGEDAFVYGPTIRGDLTIHGARASVSFTRVDGKTSVSADATTLIHNQLCGGATVQGSETTAFGNKGMPPMDSGC